MDSESDEELQKNLNLGGKITDWGGFEKLVADLNSTGNVTVEHNVRLVGRSGAPRQIDVVVRHREGLYEHQTVVHLANKYYAASRSFDAANRRFREAISPNLNRYTMDDCIDLIEQFKGNAQTWERRGAKSDHKAIGNRMIEINPSIDVATYEPFI